MRWCKRGRIYAPDGHMPWAQHHAFPPTPHRLNDEVLRVYVGLLDEHNVGRVGYVDVLLDRPSEVVRMAQEPVLDIGAPGCFDDNGVVPTCILPVGDELWLYYAGTQLGTKVRYFQFLGLAISRDGGESFERSSRVPVLDRSHAEAHNRTSAFVHRVGERFRMYYSGGSGWTEHEGKPLPIYNVRCLESPDGASWGSEGRVCVEFASEDEVVIGRPWLMPSRDGLHRMLYSVRSKGQDYRIGLATSEDGTSWKRRDEAGIDVSETGWDSQAVGHASVVDHDGAVYLFYSGNERGKAGFGYAELESW
jgi:predicted GH43/DUF377 family glycosyl hydrolase